VGLRAALAAARTAADAARAKLSAEQIGAQQRLAGFEKLKAELEARRLPLLLGLGLGPLHAPGQQPCVRRPGRASVARHGVQHRTPLDRSLGNGPICSSALGVAPTPRRCAAAA
jgi:hypothetical protein